MGYVWQKIDMVKNKIHLKACIPPLCLIFFSKPNVHQISNMKKMELKVFAKQFCPNKQKQRKSIFRDKNYRYFNQICNSSKISVYISIYKEFWEGLSPI